MPGARFVRSVLVPFVAMPFVPFAAFLVRPCPELVIQLRPLLDLLGVPSRDLSTGHF